MVIEAMVGVTRLFVDGALVFGNEYMFTCKGSLLLNTQRLCCASVEVT